MKLQDILERILEHKDTIQKMAENLGFNNLHIYDGKDDHLHFLLDEISMPDSISRQIDLRTILEKFLGCQIEIHVSNEIRDEFIDDYGDRSMSIDADKYLIKTFFEDNLSEIRTLNDEVFDKEKGFNNSQDREDYFNWRMDSVAKAVNWTPLFIAIYRGEFGKVKKIVAENKASIKHRDSLGNNAYLLAAQYGKKEIFDWFASEEANKLGLDKTELTLDVQNSEGQTPFLAAVYGDQLDFTQHLLTKCPQEKDKLLAQMDKFKQNALAIANFYEYQEISEYLQPSMTKKDDKAEPVKKNTATTDKKINSSSVLDAMATNENWTPLFITIYCGELDTVKKIVAQDKNSIKHRDKLGNNAYLLAAKYGKKEIFDWLTSEEAQKLALDQKELTLDVRNTEGQTPLLAAVYGKQLHFVQHLLTKYPQEKDKLLAQVDRHQQNALAIAKFCRHQNIYDHLQPSAKDEKSLQTNTKSVQSMQQGATLTSTIGRFIDNPTCVNTSTAASSTTSASKTSTSPPKPTP